MRTAAPENIMGIRIKKKYIYIAVLLVFAVVAGLSLCMRYPEYVWTQQAVDPDREIADYETLIDKIDGSETYIDLIDIFGAPAEIHAARTGWDKENVMGFYKYNTIDGKQLSFIITWDGRLAWRQEGDTSIPVRIYDRPQ